MHNTHEHLLDTLQPLLKALASGRYLRVVARPQWTMADGPDGHAPVDLRWDEAQHTAVLKALVGRTRGAASPPEGVVLEPVVLPDGVTVSVLGDALVVCRPPDPMRHIDELAREGWMSLLAARTLSVALALGRNVLVAGPWAASASLISCLLAEGSRPAVVGSGADAVPVAWPRFAASEDVQTYGADRLGYWGSNTALVPGLMAHHSGVAAWIDARRLDKALMRFEACVEMDMPLSGRVNVPLHVLAAVDLVVLLSDVGGPRVREIVELDVAEDGYRPRLLFTSGIAPSPTALVPAGVPSFLGELALLGEQVLADELQHASGGASPALAPQPVVLGDTPVLPPPTSLRAKHNRAAPHATRARVVAESKHPPGWELDQLGDAADFATPAGRNSNAESMLAATYGLAPPPRPRGPNVPTPLEDFGTALGRAQSRYDAESVNTDDDTSDLED